MFWSLKKHLFWSLKRTKPAQGQKKHKFWTSNCTKPAQGQKNKSFELQSAPNLHRDKKNKKNKNFTIYLGRGDYPSKVFGFFLSLCRFGALWSSKLLVFFVPVQVWCTLKFNTLIVFVPVQVWCTLKFKTQCICSFVLWYCFYFLQIFLTHIAFFASHAAFWRVRCIFHAKGLQFEDRFDPFQKTDSVFRKLVVFSFLNGHYI